MPRPLTLLMNWGYRACNGQGRGGHVKAHHPGSSRAVTEAPHMHPRVWPSGLCSSSRTAAGLRALALHIQSRVQNPLCLSLLKHPVSGPCLTFLLN